MAVGESGGETVAVGERLTQDGWSSHPAGLKAVLHPKTEPQYTFTNYDTNVYTVPVCVCLRACVCICVRVYLPGHLGASSREDTALFFCVEDLRSDVQGGIHTDDRTSPGVHTHTHTK